MKYHIIIIICSVLYAPQVMATERIDPIPKDIAHVGVDEKLRAQVPLDLEFTESNGQVVKLGGLIDAKRPTILTLNYSDCPMLCSLQLDGFVQGLQKLEMTAGKEFNIITVSIDPNETLQRSADFKAKYIKQYNREAAATGWHFLTGSQAHIETLARVVGFRYEYLTDRQEYAHAAVLMVLSPEGIVSRYLYGILYEPRDLQLALLEAADGRIGSTLDKILLYCFHYDETKGRYAPLAMNIMRLAGLLTMLVLCGFLSLLWLKDVKKKQALASFKKNELGRLL